MSYNPIKFFFKILADLSASSCILLYHFSFQITKNEKLGSTVKNITICR
jgi:hypothetical protein